MKTERGSQTEGTMREWLRLVVEIAMLLAAPALAAAALILG